MTDASVTSTFPEIRQVLTDASRLLGESRARNALASQGTICDDIPQDGWASILGPSSLFDRADLHNEHLTLQRLCSELASAAVAALSAATAPSPCNDLLSQQEQIDLACKLISCTRRQDPTSFNAIMQSPAGHIFPESLRSKSLHLYSPTGPELTQLARSEADQRAQRDTVHWNKVHSTVLYRNFCNWRTIHNGLIKWLISLLEVRHTLARDSMREWLNQTPLCVGHGIRLISQSTRRLLDIENQDCQLREIRHIATASECSIWNAQHAALPHTLYHAPELSDMDRLLVDNWRRDLPPTDYYNSAMTSARRAELVAINVYSRLYGSATDLSIGQVASGTDDRWKRADIIACERWIDVKNARRAFSSNNSYSEFMVKRFKTDLLNHDVTISSFLSDYTKLPTDPPGEVLWLGETSQTELRRLQEHFQSDHLHIAFDGTTASRIPPWAFDYPDDFYGTRSRLLLSCKNPEFLPSAFGISPSTLSLNRHPVPSGYAASLIVESREFIKRFEAWGQPTRPSLFLHVLDRFCIALRSQQTFEADSLRRLLFFPGTSSSYVSEALPAGVLDPLLTVHNLIDVLSLAFSRCPARLSTFTHFKLSRAGVFRGCQAGQPWQTIIAYCGGRKTLKNGVSVSCGKDPLHLGLNDSCPMCGYLICDACGHCSTSCPRRKEL